MSLKSATKVELARDCLASLSSMFETGTMLDHVKAFEEREPG
jgi:hypothetical protein